MAVCLFGRRGSSFGFERRAEELITEEIKGG
jgi:hypothetical protein